MYHCVRSLAEALWDIQMEVGSWGFHQEFEGKCMHADLWYIIAAIGCGDFVCFQEKVINFDNASDQDQKKVAEDLESGIL